MAALQLEWEYTSPAMRTFLVGTTNNNPTGTLPGVDDYFPCDEVTEGLTVNGSTITVKCTQESPPSRYLFIRRQTAGRLALCEVEVYTQGSVLCDLYFVFPTFDLTNGTK